MVIVRPPVAAPPATVMFNVRCVGSVKRALFTVTPPPFTLAVSLFGKPDPGS
jgi:hypothetical protein